MRGAFSRRMSGHTLSGAIGPRLPSERVRTFALRGAHQVLARRRQHLQHADRVHALAAQRARRLGVELLGAVPAERELAEARDGFLPFGVHAHVPLRALAFADVLGDATVAGERASASYTG